MSHAQQLKGDNPSWLKQKSLNQGSWLNGSAFRFLISLSLEETHNSDTCQLEYNKEKIL